MIVPPGSKFPIAFRGFDHRQRDAVLDRAGRVLVLELDEKLTRSGIHPRDLDQRRVADQRKNRGRLAVDWDGGGSGAHFKCETGLFPEM